MKHWFGALPSRFLPIDPLRRRRVMWLLNHKTLMPAEVGVLRSLGLSVFVPKVLPSGIEFSRAVVVRDHDEALALPAAVLHRLNAHRFYEDAWPDDLARMINRHFGTVITSVYQRPLTETAKHFSGRIVARVFGREHPRTYHEIMSFYGLEQAIQACGERFVLGQGYDAVGEVEPDYLAKAAMTFAVAVPDMIWQQQNTWTGGGEQSVLLLCPRINDNPYYTDLYRSVKAMMGDIPHRIFGKQFSDVADPCVLPYLTDSRLLQLYREAPVFAYHSTEPRHVHYSPVEAMVIGTPTLYRQGSLLDGLAGRPLDGCCRDGQEMREKALRLLGGDRQLAEAIRDQQPAITRHFSVDQARHQWGRLL
ncbi:hypothetical protein [Hydrogenophaga sp. OTU3427]|uniref:hypothetical protein n=1 Tax=Hydrogenophaga sp. OTU3427 TaxID=3043856 RepID=UPI00313B1524